MITFYPEGTLASEPPCVVIDDRHWQREFAMLSSHAAKPVAEMPLKSFRNRLKTDENPLRGRVFAACVTDRCVRITVSRRRYLRMQRKKRVMPK